MLTVQDLAGIEELGLELIAGAIGAERLIAWAHAVDLPDPWRWISPGSLVMTTGMGFPKKAHEQIVWLERLVQSNACALVFAPRPGAPKLSREMLQTADRLQFPVFLASFEIEFVKLSKFVIESVLQTQRERFNASERLFQSYAEALRKAPDMSGRLALLADALNLDLAIEDAVSGVHFVQTRPIACGPNAINTVEKIPIVGRSRANLVIGWKSKKSLDDPILVRSLVGLLGVEIERLMIHRDLQRDEGSALLRSLLESEMEFTLARPILDRHGLTGTLVTIAISPGMDGAWMPQDIHHAPALHASTPLLLQDNDVLLVLGHDDPGITQFLCSNLGAATLAGVSGPIATATGFRESVRQARMALMQAREIGAQILRYGEVETGLIMAPKSLEEARALVGRYLGPLIAHDRAHGSSLLATLMAFLEKDGNWKATAFEQRIHRQTLVYRLKLVEQLTGIKPTTTSGIARFWIAIQAGKNTKLLP